MISNPKHGWCNFNLDDCYKGTPSYLTDVPVDLLTAFIDFHEKGCGAAWFNEEGEEFTIVLTPYSLFIIEEKDKPILHDFLEINIEELEKELIRDIEFALDDWQYFITDNNPVIIENHRKLILEKIEILKKYVRGEIWD